MQQSLGDPLLLPGMEYECSPNEPSPYKKVPFPRKLWEAAEEGDLIKWSKDGEAIFTNENQFESQVMEKYPGLVQIPSFVNFRRQLREYCFSWWYDKNMAVYFKHPCFQRDRKELLPGVLTRKRSAGKVNSPDKSKAVQKTSGPLKESHENNDLNLFTSIARGEKKNEEPNYNHPGLELNNTKGALRLSNISKLFERDQNQNRILPRLSERPQNMHYNMTFQTPQPMFCPSNQYSGYPWQADTPQLASQDWYKHCEPWMPRPKPSKPMENKENEQGDDENVKEDQEHELPVALFPGSLFKGVWEWGLQGWPVLQLTPGTRDKWQDGETRSYFSL